MYIKLNFMVWNWTSGNLMKFISSLYLQTQTIENKLTLAMKLEFHMWTIYASHIFKIFFYIFEWLSESEWKLNIRKTKKLKQMNRNYEILTKMIFWRNKTIRDWCCKQTLTKFQNSQKESQWLIVTMKLKDNETKGSHMRID